jgi:hypothetical protein
MDHTLRSRSAIEAARHMPLLPYHVPGECFDISRSHVVRWLCDQPEIQQEIFNYCKRNRAIVYDDGKRRGVDFVTRFRFLNAE